MSQTLEFKPAIEHLNFVSPTIQTLLKQWTYEISVEQILVAEINPEFMNGTAFGEQYGIPSHAGANCAVVEAKRGDDKTYAACVVPVNAQKTDFNGVARKHLDARRVSFAPLDFVLEQTDMEYGSITPIGLPKEWRVLVDSRVMDVESIVIGSGLQKSKLRVPTALFKEMHNTDIVDGLGRYE